jgi:hypothetical protein
MVRILAILAALGLLANVAMADCAEQCDNGFNVCMRNCGGQAGCLETCSRGRSGCLRRCGGSQNFTPVPSRWLARLSEPEAKRGPVGQSCIGGGETCTVHGTPCCPPYTCKGRFPNTTCLQ